MVLKIIKKILEKNNILHINLIHNLGIVGEVQTGYKYALENNYGIAVQFEGDGQHDVRYVLILIKPIIDGKFKSSKARRFGIGIISFFMKLFTGKKIYHITRGFRAVNREIIDFFAMYYPTEYP